MGRICQRIRIAMVMWILVNQQWKPHVKPPPGKRKIQKFRFKIRFETQQQVGPSGPRHRFDSISDGAFCGFGRGIFSFLLVAVRICVPCRKRYGLRGCFFDVVLPCCLPHHRSCLDRWCMGCTFLERHCWFCRCFQISTKGGQTQGVPSATHASPSVGTSRAHLEPL